MVVGLGTVWILDGLEVTIVGAIASRLTKPESGLGLNESQIGLAASFYVLGACAVDLISNGSFWLGTVFGGALAWVLLNEGLFSANLGWRLAFGLGAVLGLGILLVRRNVPQSPRWLFIRGHSEQAEELVDDVERRVEEETGERLEPVEDSIVIRQRRSIGFGVIAATAFRLYSKRTVLGWRCSSARRSSTTRCSSPSAGAEHLLQGGRRRRAALHRAVRGRQRARPGAARPPVRHRRPAPAPPT